MEVLTLREVFAAFAGEFSAEIEEEEAHLGQLGAIYDEKDASKRGHYIQRGGQLCGRLPL